MMVSGPSAAIVSKHSSKMDEIELLDERGLEVIEVREARCPLGWWPSSSGK